MTDHTCNSHRSISLRYPRVFSAIEHHPRTPPESGYLVTGEYGALLDDVSLREQFTLLQVISVACPAKEPLPSSSCCRPML